jgi:hypothetical protein
MYTLDLPLCKPQTTFSSYVEEAHARKKSSEIVEKMKKPKEIVL